MVTIMAMGCDGGGQAPAAPDAGGPDGPVAIIDAPPPPPPPIDAAGTDPLDHGFGTDGLVTFDGTLTGLVIQRDQKIVISGTRSRVPPALTGVGFLERRLPSGALDPSFDGDGIVEPLADASGVAVLADGRLVTTGRTLRVFGPDGGLLVAIANGSDRRWFERPIAMADGGFAVVVADRVMLATAYNVWRYDAALQFMPWGSAPALFNANAGATTLAHLTADGGDHLVLSTEGQLTSRATATGLVDGGFAGFSWAPATAAVTLHDGLTQVAAIDALPDAMRIRSLTPGGALGPEVLAAGCVPSPSYARPAVARDGSGRLWLAPWGGNTDPVVSLVRIAPALNQLDPAWGCGRTFRVPPHCPPGQPCLGTLATDHLQTIALAIADDGHAAVGGYLWRVGDDLARGFVARVAP